MPNNPYSPKENLKDMSEQAIEAIKGYFPDGKFEGKRQTLKLLDVSVEDNLPEEDYAMEQEVKEKDGTWAVPIKAKFALIDNETKKVVDTREMTLGRLPKMTNRFSYIIDGKERQVDHQSLLKRGMFTRIADDGKLETRFNTKTPDQYQTQFQVFFDPDSHVYQVKVGDTEAPLLPVMRAMGVPENQIKETWGAKVYQDNQVTNEETKKHLKRLYRRIARKDTDDMDELIKTVRDHFGSLSLDKEVTKMVVGKEYEKVNGDAFLSATKALLDINRGEKKPTGYDDLRFKEIRHTEDFVAERIRESAKSIIPKLKNNIDRAERVEQVVNTQIFNRPIKSFFTTSQISTLGDQTNPLGMITGQTKHTIMGEHGISDSHQVTIDAKIIHPSSYGFLDPCHTPESSRTGINLQIPLGAWKEGKELKTRVINARTGKEEIVSATQLASANVAFPDQYVLRKEKPPESRSERVVVADKDGQTSEVSPKEVDYVFKANSNLFSATVNLIPFLGSNNQNRVGYGTQQAHQALALKSREEPLVQSSADLEGNKTFEESLGLMMGHSALASGTVTKIDDRYIYIKDAAGRIVKNALYNHFPTNNKKGELHSTPLVSVGDKVEKGQPIADHSFTRGGKLALGTNLTVGYIPAEGYNFEDGVVISESAAKKMASEHLYKKEMDIGSDSVHLGRKKFMAMDQVRYTKEQLAHIGEDGVVALGTRVKPGDPLVLALKKNEVRSEAEGLSKVSKGMVSDWKADPIEWEGDYEGEVVKIINTGKKIKVHVATLEPMQIGDKIVGRHGNKGICTQIRPDSEMPKFIDPVDGTEKNLQVMLNPLGVPGRINAGQLLETSASLIARKTGKPYKVTNFDPRVGDFTEKVEKELAALGLKPTTQIIDPKTGEALGEIHLGEQYMLKLDQQVSKKMSARGAGYGEPYDGNRTATTGGGRLGALGNFAMLAHGAVHNLREMQTIKTSFDDETWRAIQMGEPLPTPKPSYAYEKFDSFLKGMGVNIKKEGTELVLEPLTDAEVLKLSNGEVRDPGLMLRAKDLRAENGGLFDPRVFGKEAGGLKGDKWGHIKLDTAMPNPVFEEPILKLTGLRQADFENILAGQQEHNGQTGPEAIGAMLDRINVKEELKTLKTQINTAPPAQVDLLNKKIRYLSNLSRLGLTPREAYMKTVLPVLPPLMRPVSEMGDGSLNTDDLNGLYRGVGLVNRQLTTMNKDLKAIPQERGKLHAALYDGMKALTGIGTLPNYHQAKRDKLQGIMHKIEGPNPKLGFFQKNVMARKQDMSMRSTIIPNQEIQLDEIALPREGAVKMFAPHLVRELRAAGLTTLGAKEAIKKNDPLVDKVLEKVMKEVPVLAKRDPVLHKFGIQAFKPVIAKGSAIEIHPLVTGGFNADFDGDQQVNRVFIALSVDAINTDCYLPSTLTQVGGEMTARMREIVVGLDASDTLFTCDLEDFPHLPDTKRPAHSGADFYEVPRGTRVLSLDEKTGKIRVVPVKWWSVHRDREVEIVNLRSGHQIITDDDERAVYGIDPQTMEFVRRRPKEADNVFVPLGRHLDIETTTSSIPLPCTNNRLRDTLILDESSGYLFGLLVGDGWLVYSYEALKGQVSFAVTDGGILEGLKEALLSFFKELPTLTRRDTTQGLLTGSQGSTSYTVSCKDFARFLNCVGRGASAKHLPPFSFCSPESFRRGVLAGWLDTDGTVNEVKAASKSKRQWQVSGQSNSLRLIREMKILAQSLGVSSTITATKTPAGQSAWRLTFSSVEAHRLGSLPLRGAKKERWEAFVGGPAPATKGSYSRNDIVPVSTQLAEHLRVHLRQHKRLTASQNVVLSNARDRNYLSRETAGELLSALSDTEFKHRHLEMFKRLTENDSVWWSPVVSYEKTGVVETGYDLTVPGFETFMSADGIVLSNTMGVFAPVTKEAIQEAHKLLPSRNLINPTYNSVVPMPSQDAMVGAYMFTKMGKRTPHTYKDEKEAIEAHDKKELRHDDVIRIGGRETTVGRVLVDRFLPLDMRGRIAYGGNALDKKLLNGLLKEMALKKPTEVPRFVQAVKDYGNKAAYRGALTISLKDIKVNKELREKMFADAKKKEEAIRKQPGLSQKEREQRVVELYRSTIEKYDGVLREDLKSRNSSMMTMMESGGMSKWVQVKQLSGAPIMFEDAKGEPVPVPVLRSYSEGLRLADFMTAAHGARMGTLSKSQGTSEPGYLSKKIVNSTIGITVTGSDCGTKRGVQMSVDDPDVIDRYLAEDVVAGKGRVLRKGTLVTPEIRDTLRNNKMSRVPVRSPLRCTHGDGVCAKCTGLSDQGKDYDQGTAIGVISAQALGEPATQMAMNAFHCLAGTSLVFIREETVLALSIEEVFNRYSASHYVLTDGITEEVPLHEGDLFVWDQDKWVGVSRIMRHAPQDRMVFLSAGQGSSICQANHPLLRLAGEDELMCAAEDMKGYRVRRSLLPCDVSWSDCPVSGYVAGMYVSEGSINYRPSAKGKEKRPYSVVFSQLVETGLADKMKDELKKWHGKYSRMGHRAYVLHSKAMGVMFEELFGRYSENKKLPQTFLGFDDEWLADFLCGYLDGDGSVCCDEKSCSAYVAAETTSYLLAQQLQVICWRLGIHSTIVQPPWRKYAKNQSFVIRVSPTEEQAKTLLGSSLRVQKMTRWRKKDTDTSSAAAVVTVVKDTVYNSKWVYDLTTQTGTLTVGGLHHHNTGGVLSPGQRTIKGGGFQQAKDLLDSKKVIAGSARLAPVAGRISNVKKDPAGGFRVAIQGTAGTKEVYVPALRQGLSVGTQVKAGDALSEGTVNPHDLLPLAGLDAVRQTLTDQLAQSYGGVRKRHVEMVVRSLTDTARVEDTGGREDIVRGDVASASYLASLNEQSGAGAGKVKYTPVLKGVNYLPLQSQDWASRLNFNRLRDTVAEGAAMGFRSDIHGTNPLPGLMYGAEFGRPVAGKKSKF